MYNKKFMFSHYYLKNIKLNIKITIFNTTIKKKKLNEISS